MHPKISPRIIPNIATLYNDVSRIFMEYIDNSIDSADVNWFNESENSYSRPIKIKIQIHGNDYKNGVVEIIDNCFGITNFPKVVESIGDSDKKNNRFTNGQFGFGIYYFMAACSDLKITSKLEFGETLELKLNKKQFDKKRVEEVIIPEPIILKDYIYKSGTKIELSGFDKDSWKEISADNLKTEVEKHFELIIRRENLTIEVVDQYNNRLKCNPFDYMQYEGDFYEDDLASSVVQYKRGKPYEYKFPANQLPHIFIKITENVALGKPPVFFSQGRRIDEIKNIRSFRSKHKSDIWDHPNVTGYIDLKDNLGPTIARTDFRNTEQSRIIFNMLLDLEDLIYEKVKKATSRSEEKHYSELEDTLNKALAKLARIDAMNFRTTHLSGGNINLLGGSSGEELSEGTGLNDIKIGGTRNPGEGPGIGEGDEKGVGPNDDGEDLPGGELPGNKAKDEAQFDDSEFKGTERKKSGFNIRISDAEPQVNAENNKPFRSILSGNEIIIFKQHPDFQKRINFSRRGESRITDRFIAYIATEITIHYKDKLYNKHQHGQPEYNKDMFIGMAEFIYQLEDMLTSLSGKNLSELSIDEK